MITGIEGKPHPVASHGRGVLPCDWTLYLAPMSQCYSYLPFYPQYLSTIYYAQ